MPRKKKHQQYIVGKTKQKTIPTLDYGKNYLNLSNFSKEWVNVILDLQIKDDIEVAYLNKDDPSGGGKSGPRLLQLTFTDGDAQRLGIEKEYIIKHCDSRQLWMDEFKGRITRCVMLKLLPMVVPDADITSYGQAEREFDYFEDFNDTNGRYVQNGELKLKHPKVLKNLKDWQGKPKSLFKTFFGFIPYSSTALILEKMNVSKGWHKTSREPFNQIPKDILYKIAEVVGQFHGSHFKRKELATSIDYRSPWYNFIGGNLSFLDAEYKKHAKDSKFGNCMLTNNFVKFRDEGRLFLYKIPEKEHPRPKWFYEKECLTAVYSDLYIEFSKVLEIGFSKILQKDMKRIRKNKETFLHGMLNSSMI